MSNVLKLDRDSISKSWVKETYTADKEKPIMGTRFGLDFEKRSQCLHIKEKLDQVGGSKTNVIYTVSKKYDYIFKLTAHTRLFPIKVKEQYAKSISICYHHNLGHNILPLGECEVDDEHVEFIDTITQDCYSQFFISRKDLYDQMIGNVPCLEKWNTELPSYPIIVPQHFSIFRSTQGALPLLKSARNKVTFDYKVRLDIKDLLRMRMYSKGEYKEIKCNLSYLEYESPTIPIPELWGRYAEISEEERKWKKDMDEKGQPIKQILYIEDINITNSKNPKSIGTVDVIPLECQSPAKHIFWVASLVGGNFSNYTTDKSNPYKGWNPCAKSCIKYGDSDRVEELGHEHFDLAEVYDFNFPNFPREAGYNVHTYTFNPTNTSYSDSCVILKNCGASLHVTLGDTNPFLKNENEEEYLDENGEVVPIEALENENQNEMKKDKYTVHVRTIISRKLEVYWDHQLGNLKYQFV